MNRDKLLYLLDIDDNNKKDKGNIKALLIFDIVFLFVIVGVGMLFQCISNSIFNIAAIAFFFCTTIIFYIWYKKVNNLVSNVIYMPLILLKSTLELFYGYWIFSTGEMRDYGYQIFSWIHATIAIAFFIGIVYISLLYIKLYRDAKRMSLQELIDRSNKTKARASDIVRSHPWIVILPALLPSPYIASKIFNSTIQICLLSLFLLNQFQLQPYRLLELRYHEPFFLKY